MITIFDDDMHSLGVKMRKEAHTQGYWHETFHCWFTRQDAGKTYLLFQLRALQKKDFPGKLDITAAGHLLAGEKVADGIREIKEELGSAPAYSNLLPVGIIKDEIILGSFIDREFSHVYLYKYNGAIDSFVLLAKEVAGILQVEVNAFSQLIHGETDTVQGVGYRIEMDGSKSLINTNYSRSDFCPHSKQYFLTLLQAIKSQ